VNNTGNSNVNNNSGNPCGVNSTPNNSVNSSTVNNNIQNVVSNVVQSNVSTSNNVTSNGTNNSNINTSLGNSTSSEPVMVQSTVADSTQSNDLDGAIVNENLKKVEINYTPPSKAKTSMMILIFVMLIAFVIFLPNITNFLDQYKASKNVHVEEVIESGKLECELKSNTENLDMTYLRVFKYTDNKLDSANYTITTTGDVSLDEGTLNEIGEKCELLAENTKKISGVEIDCTQSDGKVIEKQSFVFGNIDYDKLDAAFTEAGGTYPEFESGQDISSIEKTMNASGYKCTRMR